MKPMSALRKHQTGAVAVMVGLTIFVLVLFLGMTVDLGRLFITKTELSNAADACALAAAAELKGDADSLNRAVNAGIAVGAGTPSNPTNKVDFQSSAITIPESEITFSDQLADDTSFRPKTAIAPSEIANMKYAKCRLPLSGIVPYFMRVVDFGDQTVTSHAVATLVPGITNCGLPIGMCKQKVCKDGSSPDVNGKCPCPGGGLSDELGFCKNEWYCSKFTVGGSTANPSACPGFGSTGNFNLIDFSPPSGGASELAAIITGSGQCNLNITTPVGQTGVEQSIAKAWNTRFGLYKGSDSVSTAPPDYSGFAYTPTSWPSQSNAFAGTSANGAPNLTSARTSHLIYQNNAGTWPDGLNLSGYQNSTSGQLAASGGDRRVAVVPIVDCDAWAGSQTTPIIKFACIVMLHPMNSPSDPTYLEYQGMSDDPSSPCATTGLPGGSGSVGPRVPALVR
jgi:hypothetical protein